MNRENYDPKVISTFEIIGSFFVDAFYNDLYLKAKDKVKLESRSRSLTDAYKYYIEAYMYGIKSNKEHYSGVIKNLHKYYQVNTRYFNGGLVFSDFENKILSQFIPPEYYQHLNEREKDSSLCMIITETICNFGVKVCDIRYLSLIIDDHKNEMNVRVFQDIIIDVMIMIREKYFNLFAKKIHQKNDKVPIEIVEKMKEALQLEIKRRCKAEEDLERTLNIIKQLTCKINEFSVPKSETKPKEVPSQNNTRKAKKSIELPKKPVEKVEVVVKEPEAPIVVESHSSSSESEASSSESDSEVELKDNLQKQRELISEKMRIRGESKDPILQKPVKIEVEEKSEYMFDDPGFG